MERKTNKKATRMTKGEIEKKKKRIIKIFLAIVIMLVLAIIAYIANDYIIIGNNENTNLVINNRNVTENLKNGIIKEDDDIYMSEQDLANFFDKYIYEDQENNQIVTTYENKIATIGFEENVMTINGSEKETYAHAREEGDTIYLPITELKDVYGIEIEYLPDTNILTIDSVANEQKKAIVNGNTAVKSSTNFIAKTVDRIEKGEYVIVISQSGNYSRIRTSRGKIGYIKTKKIETPVVTRESIEEEKQIEGKVNLIWDYYSQVATAPNREGTTIDGINVVSPAFFHLNQEGDLEENVGDEGKAYVTWAHNNGYKVWPMVQNAGSGMTEVTSDIMNSFDKRQELIEKIVKGCLDYELDGINIDFENMKKDDIDLFSRFIIELEPRLKSIGVVLSVDVTAPDGADNWSLCFDRNVLGDVADYLIFMAYDQYGASSDKAGTTAGYNWIELNIKKFLETYEVESEKLVLGIPFYTRLWEENGSGELEGQEPVPMNEINETIPSGVQKQWDDELKQNYVEYEQNGMKYKMWIEDTDSLKEKVSLVKKYNLGGVAAWEKGMETDEVWEVIKEALN